MTVTLGCLPAFAPNIRAADVHAGLDESSVSKTCMDCHTSEHDAMQLDTPTRAPIVADWMLAETRTCVDCHQVRAHPRRAARDQLPSLAEVGRAN
jgi:nitrate/TMAO reductase-like tetraheme cytochrome c subunit